MYEMVSRTENQTYKTDCEEILLTLITNVVGFWASTYVFFSVCLLAAEVNMRYLN